MAEYFCLEYNVIKIEFTRTAYKSVAFLPSYIVAKLKTWIAEVALNGLLETRKRTGFHDEPLQGKRAGQRSVRLNRSYRVIYREVFDGHGESVIILEISKHDY